MIDIHTHVLPFCDDGADSLDQSINELTEISKSGVTDVFLTPHYIRNVFENSRESTQAIYQELKLNLLLKGVNINIHPGAEVYLDDNIWNDIEKYNLQLADTKYVLVETGFNGFPSDLLDILYQLVKRGYKPILAHPERYIDIIKNLELAEDLIYRNVYLQMNAGSFLGYYGNMVQKTAWQLLKKKLVHFLASDTHCNSDYYFLKEALQTVVENTEAEFIEQITTINPGKLLQNKTIEYNNTYS
jgi:protein-tyrosine phosphatase